MSKQNLDSEDRSKYFIYVGNAYPHKNLNRLIQAMVLLNKGLNEIVKLKIVSGRNVFTERLEESIKKYEASVYVKLLGFVPDIELNKLYKNSVAFVFASLSEGFGLPGLEAMNAGTLVLASTIPVFKEIYQNNVIYFDPSDVNSIKLALEQTLRMPKEERIKMINQEKQFAKRYSWVKMARETLKVYEEVTKDRASLR